jgi:hypothetical protein
LAKYSSQSLVENRENLNLSFLNHTVLGCKDAAVGIFFLVNVCRSANLVRTETIIIDVQVFHVAFPGVYWNLLSNFIFLQIVDQHKVVLYIVLLLVDESQEIQVFPKVAEALEGQLDLKLIFAYHVW